MFWPLSRLLARPLNPVSMTTREFSNIVSKTSAGMEAGVAKHRTIPSFCVQRSRSME